MSRSAEATQSSDNTAQQRLAPGDITGLMAYLTEDFNQHAYFITGASLCGIIKDNMFSDALDLLWCGSNFNLTCSRMCVKSAMIESVTTCC